MEVINAKESRTAFGQEAVITLLWARNSDGKDFSILWKQVIELLITEVETIRFVATKKFYYEVAAIKGVVIVSRFHVSRRLVIYPRSQYWQIVLKE
jgi:hypothetical protein